MPRETVDQRIMGAAASDGGLVTSHRLRDIGISASAVSRRIASGFLTLVVPGVYAVAACGAPSLEVVRRASVLRCNGPAGLGLETAASRLGLWNRDDDHVHVVSNRILPRGTTRGVTWHAFSCLDHASIVDVEGTPTTNVTRTCADLGGRMTPHQLTYVLARAHVKRMLDLDALDDMLATQFGVPYVRCVRRAVQLFVDGSAGTKNGGEDALLGGFLGAGLPEPRVNVRGITGMPGYEPDFVWPGHRLVVELDGAGAHSLPGAAEQDRLRDEQLVERGWTIRRYTGLEAWHDLDGVVRGVAQTLAQLPLLAPR